MSSVSSATSAAATTTTTSATSGSTGGTAIAGNFQQFLTLLTTQLRNQSPLDPLDTNQFTQQLVQFASVEQQLKTNDQLSSILSSVKTTSTANAASYIGLNVTLDGSTATLANGQANWTINPAKAAAKATFTIKNAAGTTVATRTTTLAAGTQAFTWDGKDGGGSTQAAGDYTLSISAVDATGQPLTVATDVSGTVSAVDVSGTTPSLTVGTVTMPLSRVKTVSGQSS